MTYDCLIIDDERMLAQNTAEYFNLFGVSTYAVFSVEECLSFFENNRAQLLLLDINLEDGSGFDLCKHLRKSTDIPIMFISARTSDDDKIVALNIGGDDYVQKPYSLGVLLAKVKAMLKRCRQSSVGCFSDGRMTIDTVKRQLTIDGVQVKLKALEFKLLAYLVDNRDRVVSKAELFDNVWHDKFTGDGTLNVHIRRIREVIERDANNPEYIVTVWGEGYKFNGGDR